jgi:Ca-activated chloride channel homolog
VCTLERATILLRNSRITRYLAIAWLVCLTLSAQTNSAPGAPNGGSQSPATPSSSLPPASVPKSTAAAPAAAQDPLQNGQTPATQKPAAGSQSSGDDEGTFVFKQDVEEVLVHATVMDDKTHHLVTNLDKDAFNIFENDQKQNITFFRHEDIPVAMGIVIDNSGSMREKRDKVNKAALNLVRSSNPQDQVFVVNFNDEYYLDQDFTNNMKKLQDALEKVEARGGTALYDALLASADWEKRYARLQKRVIFVVTDGEDNASRVNLEGAVRRLQSENGPTVYAIGLLGEERARRARRALELISERTGGMVFFPKTLDEVDEISKTVAHDIRNQYTIGYKPTSPKSAGGYRSIRVEAKAKGYGKLAVRTRSGYYPGQEQSQ